MPNKNLISDSGLNIKTVYTPQDLQGLQLEKDQPGEWPFTRGIQSDMYRGKPWTIRQYAGFKIGRAHV